MSFTINSMVFKVFLPILIGLAIFATLDSIKVNSLDPQVDNLNEAIQSFNREITLARTENDQEVDEEVKNKARAKFREAVIFNMMAAQHCGLVQRPENATAIREYPQFLEEVRILSNSYGGNNWDWSSTPEFLEEQRNDLIYYPAPGDSTPYEVLNEDGVSLTCAGADRFGSSFPGIDAISTDEGNDMEGRYGRISVNVENTVNIEKPDVASFLFYDVIEEGTYPELLGGLRLVRTAPGACENEAIYNSNLRMQNTPLVMEGLVFENYTICDRLDYAEITAYRPDSVDYVLCEGVSGYIQTNIGGLSQTGEAETGQGSITGLLGELYGQFNLGVISGSLANVETFPKFLIRTGGATDCLEDDRDLVKNTNQIIEPVIDTNQDGEREKCSYEDVKSAINSESTEEWNNLNIKCGLEDVSPNNDYYKTMWYAPDGQQCNQNSWRIKSLFDGDDRSIPGLNYRMGEDKPLILLEPQKQGVKELRYNLENFEEINTIEITFERNERSTYELLLNNNLFLRSRFNNDFNQGDHYLRELIPGDNTRDTWDYGKSPKGDEIISNQYKLRINNEEDRVSWSGSAGSLEEDSSTTFQTLDKQINLEEDIDSFTINMRNQRGADNGVTISDISVTGDLYACS